METIFTVGHGTRSSDELNEILRAARIDLLIDVRRFPGSRRHPQFSKNAVEKSLSAVGVEYDWQGDALGGRRKANPESENSAWRNAAFRAYADHMDTEEFRRALTSIKDRAATTRQALMCAETLWWRCHRRLIADALVVGGFEVVHLGVGKDGQHKLTETARRVSQGRLVYDVES